MPLLQLALLASLAVPAAPDPTMGRPVPADLAPDEQILKAANLPVTEQGLLDFFRKRTPSAANDAAVAPLVEQLAEKDPARHTYAAGELIALGSTAIKGLRVLANQLQDPDAAARARNCLEHIEGPGGAVLVSTVARLLAAHRPEPAAAVLIDYYPFAEDESVTRDLDHALVAVALRDGKPAPAMLRALEDESPIRRAAAAVALCEAAGIGVHERVRPLLKDPKPTVRFQVAMALAKAHDAEVLPILIDLLADQPSAQRRQAEELLTELAGEWAVKVPQGNDATARRLRRELWLAWWNSLDGKQLLEEFTSRTLSDEDFGKVQTLLKKLDGTSADEREQATQELVGTGPKAVPLLRQWIQRTESRTGPVAQKCIDLIEKGMPNPLPPPAARLLALRRPPGTLEAFLAYIPFAENEATAAEITDLIGAVGVREGKPDPVLLKALDDKVPSRRTAAAMALSFSGSSEQLPLVRKLLHDPEPEVRLRVALALATVRQRDAVPVLIALLPEVSLTNAYEIEDFLMRLAVEKAPPKETLTVDAASRTKCRDVWEAWWKENGQTVDLAKIDIDSHNLGLTLVVEMHDAATRAGRVVELDAAGKIRWKMEGLLGPVDAQRLPGQRLLVAEQNANRVTERDRNGKIIWEHVGTVQPFVVQRLRDGNTFIAGRNGLLIVDRNGKQVFSSAHPNEYFLGATSFRDGQMAYVNNQGQYVRLDATGKELKRYTIPFNPNFGMNSAEILPNDNVIVSVQAASKITEYSPDGKTVWEANVAHNGVTTRLSNGRTLVPNYAGRRIAVLDRDGKLVSEMKDLPVLPWRVSKR